MPRKQPAAVVLALSALALAPACAGRGGGASSGNGGSGSGASTGTGGSSPSTGSGGSGTGGSSSANTPSGPGLTLFSDTCTAGSVSVGPSPIRRLSRVEYNNIVRDLGLDPNNTQPANQFVAEQKISGNFNTNSYAPVSGTLINQQYLQAAETLAAAAVTGSNLSTLVSCASQANAACAQTFIGSFANRAFRGQLDSTESAALLALYTTVSAQFDFATGIQAVLEAILTSPRFLYVLEFGQTGTSGDAVPLTPMELATRLSLYLWRSIPDQTLMTAASNGQLVTASDITTQATRMLADPKASGALQDFANQWLDIENMDGVTKDTQFQTWTGTLAHELHTETLTTFQNSVTVDNTSYTSLLTSTSSYLNSDLSAWYQNPTGTTVQGTDTNYKKTSAGTGRVGILTDASVLASHAHTSLPSPTLRGRLIRQQILCEPVPDPPASVGGVPIPPPPATLGTETTRQKYLDHVAANSACNTCHQYMDWIGFGFDEYDATGALYANGQENGQTIDPSGKFISESSSDISGTFADAPSMITDLSQSAQVDQCFALEQMRYALGRVEAQQDACSAQQIYQAFSSNSFNIQKLLIAVVTSNSFMYRTPVSAGQECQ